MNSHQLKSNDSPLDDHGAESGVRVRIDVSGFITTASNDHPSAVYFELMGERVYLGVRFELGVIAGDRFLHDVVQVVWQRRKCFSARYRRLDDRFVDKSLGIDRQRAFLQPSEVAIEIRAE